MNCKAIAASTGNKCKKKARNNSPHCWSHRNYVSMGKKQLKKTKKTKKNTSKKMYLTIRHNRISELIHVDKDITVEQMYAVAAKKLKKPIAEVLLTVGINDLKRNKTRLTDYTTKHVNIMFKHRESLHLVVFTPDGFVPLNVNVGANDTLRQFYLSVALEMDVKQSQINLYAGANILPRNNKTIGSQTNLDQLALTYVSGTKPQTIHINLHFVGRKSRTMFVLSFKRTSTWKQVYDNVAKKLSTSPTVIKLSRDKYIERNSDTLGDFDPMSFYRTKYTNYAYGISLNINVNSDDSAVKEKLK